jgi:tRNA/tmRNA/rRNA uracil-C5-methylase (TrmA/RlmC/RlmD family)
VPSDVPYRRRSGPVVLPPTPVVWLVGAKNRAMATVTSVPDDVLELEVGAIAAGGGCVARVPDGRVVFVRHCLPGERVRARITSEATSYLRADAVEVLDASPDRVAPACPHAGPGRCGGCDFQHVALPAQRRLKEDLIAEQLSRLAGLDLRIEVEEVDGAPGGLGWRTRVSFAVDGEGGIGLRRHRSHDIEPVVRCPIATDGVNDAGVGSVNWRGARQLEVFASPDGGTPVVLVETGKERLDGLPDLEVGLVWKGRTLRAPDHVEIEVDGNRFAVGAGVFWQVHPSAGPLLTRVVLEGLGARPGDRVADLYAGAGLFTVTLARVVGPRGVVVAVERSGPAVADLKRNATGLAQVEVLRSNVTPDLVASRLGRPDLVVLDPARAGAGRNLVAALVALDPPPRRVAYVSCEPAPFARDLKVALEAGWTLRSLRAFDLFPMTEHVELVGILEPPPA